MAEKIVVIGGCGHVGLPLGVMLAINGRKVTLIDIDQEAVDSVRSGRFPFMEKNGDELLQQALSNGLEVTADATACKDADVVIFATSTPTDEHLNPKLSKVLGIFDFYQPYFKGDALILVRATQFAGTMEHLRNRIDTLGGLKLRLAFCPERVAHGAALEEIPSQPQIIAAFDDESFARAYDVFKPIVREVIRLEPLEAELAKLMTNCWRYLEFAIANQFYMIAESGDADFNKIYQAIRYRYPRAKGFKAPGFTAGPRLFRDTMHLASFCNHQFYMGHSAMLVNEGLSDFIVEEASTILGGELADRTIGLLGMTFKPDNDDIRESLSFRVKKGLEFRGANVLCNDPYWPASVELKTVLSDADLLILTTPHKTYAEISTTKPVIDVWGFFPQEKIEIFAGTEEAAKTENRAANQY